MKRVFWLLVATLLLASAVWLYQIIFPGAETIIRKTLTEVEKYASFNSEEKPVSGLANVQKLASYFTEDVVIRLNIDEGSDRTMEGRESLLQAAHAARSTLSSLRLELVEPRLQILPDKESAIVMVTLKATPSNGELQAQEIKLSLRKKERRWIISRVEAVKNLNFKRL